jgi:alkanesulfonate monooxygenase SsuD/methylene tetrahydromethanopterin reductase-like flavin-dependent oxidoreductase (luciferase family)
MAWEAHSLSVLTEGRFEMGIGTGRPGIEDELRELGLPVVTPSQRLSQVRDTVTSLRELDGPDLHTPVAMAVRGPKAQALAADLADTVTFAPWPGDSRAEMMRLAADFRAIRDVELALHVPVVGDAVAPFMTPQTRTRPRYARRTRSWYSRATRRRPPKKSCDDARRAASHISSSAPTPLMRSLLSSPS